jgi:hypothetical protein
VLARTEVKATSKNRETLVGGFHFTEHGVHFATGDP